MAALPGHCRMVPALPQAVTHHRGGMVELVSVCIDFFSEMKHKSCQQPQLLGGLWHFQVWAGTHLHSLQPLGFIQTQPCCWCLSTTGVPDNILIFSVGIRRVFAWCLLYPAHLQLIQERLIFGSLLPKQNLGCRNCKRRGE